MRTLIRRPAWRTAASAVAALSTAVVLVAGVNSISAAAGGPSLQLGKANQARATTTLKNTGPGPALRLSSRPAVPPLAVSNSRKVARLNADQVDGKDATALEPTTYRWSLGADGAAVPQTVFETTLPAGTYTFTVQGLVTYGAARTECLLGDRSLVTESGDDGDFFVIAANQAQRSTLSGLATVRVAAGQRLVYGCQPEPGGTTMPRAVSFTAQAVTGGITPRTGTPLAG